MNIKRLKKISIFLSLEDKTGSSVGQGNPLVLQVLLFQEPALLYYLHLAKSDLIYNLSGMISKVTKS
jgi:hypothetical protein